MINMLEKENHVILYLNNNNKEDLGYMEISQKLATIHLCNLF